MKAIQILFFTLASVYASAQDSSLAKEQYDNFLFLRDSCSNKLGYGCGYVGQFSENFQLTGLLISSQRIDLLKELLDSKIPATQFLAAKALMLMNRKTKWKIDAATKEKILMLHNSKEDIPFCIGCTGGGAFSLGSLLSIKRKRHIFSGGVDNQLKKYLPAKSTRH